MLHVYHAHLRITLYSHVLCGHSNNIKTTDSLKYFLLLLVIFVLTEFFIGNIAGSGPCLPGWRPV